MTAPKYAAEVTVTMTCTTNYSCVERRGCSTCDVHFCKQQKKVHLLQG